MWCGGFSFVISKNKFCYISIVTHSCDVFYVLRKRTKSMNSYHFNKFLRNAMDHNKIRLSSASIQSEQIMNQGKSEEIDSDFWRIEKRKRGKTSQTYLIPRWKLHHMWKVSGASCEKSLQHVSTKQALTDNPFDRSNWIRPHIWRAFCPYPSLSRFYLNMSEKVKQYHKFSYTIPKRNGCFVRIQSASGELRTKSHVEYFSMLVIRIFDVEWKRHEWINN